MEEITAKCDRDTSYKAAAYQDASPEPVKGTDVISPSSIIHTEDRQINVQMPTTAESTNMTQMGMILCNYFHLL